MRTAIFADEAMPGDIVMPERGAMEKRVLSLAIRDDGGCEMVLLNLKTATAETVIRSRNAALILLHRPLPEGKTEDDVLRRIEAILNRCALAETEIDGRILGIYVKLITHAAARTEALRSLREALEAYELGLKSTQQSDPDDDMDPRAEESC